MVVETVALYIGTKHVVMKIRQVTPETSAPGFDIVYRLSTVISGLLSLASPDLTCRVVVPTFCCNAHPTMSASCCGRDDC